MTATRIIEESQWAAWNKEYQAAAESLDGREARVEEAANRIERDLELVGVTAIEDKLQHGVPEAIDILLRAGTKVCNLAALTKVVVESALSYECIWVAQEHDASAHPLPAHKRGGYNTLVQY